MRIKDYEYTLKNLDWAAGVPVFENDYDDDQTGSYSLLPQMLAQRINAHPEKLIADLAINGDTLLAYDSVAFFSDVSSPRTIDNLLAGTGTTLAQLEVDLNAALVAMAKFPDDQGEILNIKGTLVYCPVALERKFKRLVKSETDPTATVEGTFNPYKDIDVIADARLDVDDADDWYLFATGEIVKPFIWQMRQKARAKLEKTPHTKRWVFSADYRGNGGYGLPHLAVKTVN
jgi:phage major head subunit gpT-like protein